MKKYLRFIIIFSLLAITAFSLFRWNSNSGEASDSEKTSNVSYSFHIVDEAGKGIEGVTLKVCDDWSCQLYTSDSKGRIRFKAGSQVWQVHVLKAPEGYEVPDDLYEVSKNNRKIEITLRPSQN